MKTLLDFDNHQHKNFFLELTKRKFPNKGKVPTTCIIYFHTHFFITEQSYVTAQKVNLLLTEFN